MANRKVRCLVRVGLPKLRRTSTGRDVLLESVEKDMWIAAPARSELEVRLTTEFEGVRCGWVRAVLAYDYAITNELEWKKLRKRLLKLGWTLTEN